MTVYFRPKEAKKHLHVEHFKDLPIGTEFTFLSEHIMTWGSVFGPWRKVSTRKYIRVEDHKEFTVGSINAEVVRS